MSQTSQVAGTTIVSFTRGGAAPPRFPVHRDNAALSVGAPTLPPSARGTTGRRPGPTMVEADRPQPRPPAEARGGEKMIGMVVAAASRTFGHRSLGRKWRLTWRRSPPACSRTSSSPMEPRRSRRWSRSPARRPGWRAARGRPARSSSSTRRVRWAVTASSRPETPPSPRSGRSPTEPGSPCSVDPPWPASSTGTGRTSPARAWWR